MFSTFPKINFDFSATIILLSSIWMCCKICHFVKSISLPNDTFLDWSKLKAFADDKINVTEEIEFVFERIENIMGKKRKCWLPKGSFFKVV